MSSADGLLHALVLDGRGGARRLGWDGVEAWTPDQGVLWVHLEYTGERAIDWVSNRTGLDPLIAEALLQEESRPRATAVGDGLLVALRGVNLNPGAEPDDMVAVRLWVEQTRVISTRHRRLLSIADLAAELEAGRGSVDAPDLLVDIADRLVRRMSDTVDHAEDLVADLEERVLAYDRAAGLRADLAQLRRQTITLRRYLAPQRDALARLQAEKVGWLLDAHRLRLREVADRLIRHVEDLDAVRERAAVAQEELQSRLSEQMNSRMYVLSIIAAIFLPLGFLTGLLGVNVSGIPGAESPTAFRVFAFLLGAIFLGQLLLFRWWRWL